MASRLNLHEELVTLLKSRNVYFQPPQSIKMQYPCIRYSKVGIDRKKADDKSYGFVNQYSITAIDANPDSDICEKMLNHFSMCSYDRGYTADNLNHFVFTLYY